MIYNLEYREINSLSQWKIQKVVQLHIADVAQPVVIIETHSPSGDSSHSHKPLCEKTVFKVNKARLIQTCLGTLS